MSDSLTYALIFSKSAEKKAKGYTDTAIAALPKGLVYKGAVDYYSSLPASPSIGDCYTVKYTGSTGTNPDGTEYAWGNYEGTNQWIQVGPSITEFTENEVQAIWNEVMV